MLRYATRGKSNTECIRDKRQQTAVHSNCQALTGTKYAGMAPAKSSSHQLPKPTYCSLASSPLESAVAKTDQDLSHSESLLGQCSSSNCVHPLSVYSYAYVELGSVHLGGS